MPEKIGTPYKELADRMLRKMKTYDVFKMTEEEFYDILYQNIDGAVAKFDVCKVNLDERDENKFDELLTNIEKEILTNFMLIEYIDSNYIRVPEKMETYFSSRDLNAGSAWQQLGQIRQIRELYERQTRQMISAYSYKNSKLFQF